MSYEFLQSDQLAMLSSSNHALFKTHRLNDYHKQHKTDQPLIKDARNFVATKAPCFGATNSFGPHLLQNKKKTTTPIYYLAPHTSCEYFALEVLLTLGMITPKARIVSAHPSLPLLCHDESQPPYYMATKGLDNYIPMLAVRHDLPLKQHEEDLGGLRKQYQIDMSKQVIIDHENKKTLKISGPLFASHLLASLINDRDFGANYLNLGLVKYGHRFYAASIDKERATFDGRHYEASYKPKSPLFTTTTKDQQLAVVVAIKRSLACDEHGLCPFERIFKDSRVKATNELSANAEKYWQALKQSAQSMVEFFYAQEANDFESFGLRETWREAIADKALQLLNLPKDISSHDEAQLKQHIVQDLRGPYYQALFIDTKLAQIGEADMDNHQLILAIAKEMALECPGQAVTVKAPSMAENPKEETHYCQSL